MTHTHTDTQTQNNPQIHSCGHYFVGGFFVTAMKKLPYNGCMCELILVLFDIGRQ